MHIHGAFDLIRASFATSISGIFLSFICWLMDSEWSIELLFLSVQLSSAEAAATSDAGGQTGCTCSPGGAHCWTWTSIKSSDRKRSYWFDARRRAAEREESVGISGRPLRGSFPDAFPSLIDAWCVQPALCVRFSQHFDRNPSQHSPYNWLMLVFVVAAPFQKSPSGSLGVQTHWLTGFWPLTGAPPGPWQPPGGSFGHI